MPLGQCGLDNSSIDTFPRLKHNSDSVVMRYCWIQPYSLPVPCHRISHCVDAHHAFLPHATLGLCLHCCQVQRCPTWCCHECFCTKWEHICASHGWANVSTLSGLPPEVGLLHCGVCKSHLLVDTAEEFSRAVVSIYNPFSGASRTYTLVNT